LVKSATPRFEGHYQPYRPTWGCFDESDPRWAAREIDLAAKHGVDVMLYDWYWYSGVKIMEEGLERGFLHARNRRKVKFALMWANHHWADYFPPPFAKTWNSWLPSRHTPADWNRVVEYCAGNYFSQPNYWRVDGKLFFSLFEPARFVRELGGPEKARRVLAATNRILTRRKLPPLHLNAMLWEPEPVGDLKAAGFSSTTTYNITATDSVPGNFTMDYRDLIVSHEKHWAKFAGTPLPHCPTVTIGWDCTPRCVKDLPWPFPADPRTGKHDYPYLPVVVGNTPALFGALCDKARARCLETQPSPNAVFVNAWNEWTEGSMLLPEKRYGLGYLKALKAAFGKNALYPR